MKKHTYALIPVSIITRQLKDWMFTLEHIGYL